jgi:hypothetical protein
MDSPVHLSVAIVTYRTDAALTRSSAASPRSRAVPEKARAEGAPGRSRLYLIDKRTDATGPSKATHCAHGAALGEAQVLEATGNLGYAEGEQTWLLDRLRSDVAPSVMNPDVEVRRRMRRARRWRHSASTRRSVLSPRRSSMRAASASTSASAIRSLVGALPARASRPLS